MKGICLISSGIDSPVAAHLLLKQGMELEFLHCSNNGLESETVDIVKEHIARLETVHKKKLKLTVLNYKPQQELYEDNCDVRFQCILCKRGMYRLAEGIAKRKRIQYIVTGENLGQVASQTLENMSVLDNAVELTVLRPLLCYDKIETIKIAREIGTYKIATQDKGTCPFVPAHPVTRSTVEKIEKEEKRL